MTGAYERGPLEVADGVWAYLQPDGGWGWSNAGLITGGETSLLVDTLFDLKLTAQMLGDLRKATKAAENIETVVNTHANGDHCFGNALIGGAEMIASKACAAEMRESPASRLADLMKAAPQLGEVGEFVQRIFGSFSFEGIEVPPPTRTFEGELRLKLGERPVHLVEVGPAHTSGDILVHLPEDGVVFTGDILFHGGHPIVWAGPVSRWISACDTILSWAAETIVPGHGPMASPAAVEALKGYFEWLAKEATARFDAGMPVEQAALDIDLGPYSDWSEPERMAVNVRSVYRELGSDERGDAIGLLGAMAAWETARGRVGKK
jgi:cyclase